ncbi:transglutaminase family protein [Pedobacter sp. MC2016-14]|uniref:transglutaminase-like domain-containing protein n=1 Tax=Pedobacter sp. MC2016-14 TaxID=2897327 RepID=UPI001E47B02F|nr:transglutaminase family protein [Pedobacter sp. MC2016-14]MCD0490620.1 transglutaminase family protein [Pedobacter sp. MC2016-14]
MKFEISAKIAYQALAPSTLILNIQPFQSEGQHIIEEKFTSGPDLKMKECYAVGGEKRFSIIEIPEPGNITLNYKAIVETRIQIVPSRQLEDVPIAEMTVEALSYLNPSRYCQSDKLYKFAYNKFGNIEHAFEKVMAIRDWINKNVEYSGGYTTPQTSAYDTITQQIGVCRDFAHLGIALCRALTIPARYFTGYAYQLNPQDFHACFEAYLGGYWVIIDATKLVPINGLVKIATGLDATDNAFASIFGNLQFQQMEISTTLLENEFQYADSNTTLQGYSYV